MTWQEREALIVQARERGFPPMRVGTQWVRGQTGWILAVRNGSDLLLRELAAHLAHVPVWQVPLYQCIVTRGAASIERVPQAPARQTREPDPLLSRGASMSDIHPVDLFYIDAMAQAAAAGAQEDSCRRLSEGDVVNPRSDQDALVHQVVRYAKGAGLRLPERLRVAFVTSDHEAPRGSCEHDGTTCRVRLQAYLQGRELAEVLLHELAHAHDQGAGNWAAMSVAERERRAIVFARRHIDAVHQ